MKKKIGNYSFIVGVILAIVLGLFSQQIGQAQLWLWSFLIVMGILVGLFNVSGTETKEFLLVTVALVIVVALGKSQVDSWKEVIYIGRYLSDVFNSILAFVVPASVVVALKDVWELAKGED